MLKRLGHVFYLLATFGMGVILYALVIVGDSSRDLFIVFALFVGLPALLGYVFAGNPFERN